MGGEGFGVVVGAGFAGRAVGFGVVVVDFGEEGTLFEGGFGLLDGFLGLEALEGFLEALSIELQLKKREDGLLRREQLKWLEVFWSGWERMRMHPLEKVDI